MTKSQEDGNHREVSKNWACSLPLKCLPAPEVHGIRTRVQGFLQKEASGSPTSCANILAITYGAGEVEFGVQGLPRWRTPGKYPRLCREAPKRGTARVRES